MGFRQREPIFFIECFLAISYIFSCSKADLFRTENKNGIGVSLRKMDR